MIATTPIPIDWQYHTQIIALAEDATFIFTNLPPVNATNGLAISTTVTLRNPSTNTLSIQWPKMNWHECALTNLPAESVSWVVLQYETWKGGLNAYGDSFKEKPVRQSSAIAVKPAPAPAPALPPLLVPVVLAVACAVVVYLLYLESRS